MDLLIDQKTTIPASAIRWTATTSEGPGGQNVNRVQTRVVLRCDLTAAGLPRGVIARMRVDSPRWFEGPSVVVLSCQEHRSQRRNLAEVRAKLAAWGSRGGDTLKSRMSRDFDAWLEAHPNVAERLTVPPPVYFTTLATYRFLLAPWGRGVSDRRTY